MNTSKLGLLLNFFLLCFLPQLRAQPVIRQIFPSSGTVGSSVTISGSGFSPVPAENIVRFGGAKAVVTAASSTSLTVKVPSGFTSSKVTVAVNYLVASSSFNITFPGGEGPFTQSSFAKRADITALNRPLNLTMGDLDGDNKPELVTVNWGDSAISVYRNTSTGATLSFAARLQFLTTAYPLTIALEDVDGDGKSDIIASIPALSTINILRNTSSPDSISFSERVELPMPWTAYAIAVDDITGDGKPEIIACGNTGGLAVLQNLSAPGTMSFANPLSFTAGAAAAGIVVADVNKDGKADLLTCNSSANQVCVLSNTTSNGTPSFAAPLFFASGSEPVALAAGDFDNDGKTDIVTANSNNTASVLKNSTVGASVNFSSPLNIFTGHTGRDVAVADFNGDGKLDIGSANNDVLNTILVIRNTSSDNLSFADKLELLSSGSPVGITVGDLTSSGRLDIAAIHSNNNTISIFRNKTADQPVISSFLPVSGGQGSMITVKGHNLAGVTGVRFGNVAAMSFAIVSDTVLTAVVGPGATGKLVIIAPSGADSAAGFTFEALPAITSVTPLAGFAGDRVKITGTNFQPGASQNTVYFGAARASVNSASATELNVTVPSGATFDRITITSANHSIWSSKPFDLTFADGKLTAQSFFKAIDHYEDYNDSFTDVSLADIDGDGRTDVLLNSYPMNCFWVYRNTTEYGIISFAPRVKVPIVGSHPYALNVGDFDADGKIDVVTANDWNSTINVFRNTSSSGIISFASPKVYNVGAYAYPTQVAVGDLDGDGKPDLAVVNESSTYISVLRNTSGPGEILFADQQTFGLPSTHSSSISISDLDGDEKPDLVVASGGANVMSIFKNSSTIGSIRLENRVDIAAGHYSSYVTAGDVDGDGKNDLLVGRGSFHGVIIEHENVLAVYRNLSTPGNFAFAPPKELAVAGPVTVLLNDLDGDGRPDIVFSDGHSAVHCFPNKSVAGSLRFDSLLSFVIGDYYNTVGLAAGDLDGDGKPDIVSVNDAKETMSVLVNQNPSPVLICPTGSLDIYANLTGYSYQWQMDSGNGFFSLSSGDIFVGVNTNRLQVAHFPTTWYAGTKFRCLVSGQPGKETVLLFGNSWTGAVDTAWENPANWSCGSVPDSHTDVVVPAGDLTINSNVVVRTLRVNPGARITVTSGHNITVTH